MQIFFPSILHFFDGGLLPLFANGGSRGCLGVFVFSWLNLVFSLESLSSRCTSTAAAGGFFFKIMNNNYNVIEAYFVLYCYFY